MDISDILRDRFLRSILFGGIAIALGILYVVGRLIYFSILQPKGKSFDDEVKENSNQPMSGAESIGSISMRLGEDVRDVWGMGFSDEQIDGVLTGRYSLREMYKMKPDGNTKTEKGKEILAKKSQS